MKVVEFPLSKIVICFIIGLFTSYFIKLNFSILLVFCSILFVALFLLYKKQTFKAKTIFGLITLCLSFFIGFVTFEIHNELRNKNHYIHHISDANNLINLEIIINEQLKNTLNNDRYVANVVTLNGKESFGKIILNVKHSPQSIPLKIGVIGNIFGAIYKNRKPNNPNQFDYGKYLENQQIYAQVYTEYNTIHLSTQHEKSLNYYAAKIRDKIIRNLAQNNFKKEELSVLIALILGQQQDISPQTIKNYQFAGAVHILSVSGLHVGLLLLFVTFFLKFFPNSKYFSLLKLCITILVLWSFGVLAGLAPSVVRSVTMFSFVAVGIHLRRSVNIYHTLLVSMFLILLVKPSFLFDIGFQLSYVALFFILWLQPILKSVWSPKNKIVTYFWDILTVSFAAQIGTLPLSLYYFHQFPGLFFVTNLIILPMLSIIMALGVFVVLLAFFNYVPILPMKILECCITLLNSIIAWIASIEDFIFSDIPLTKAMLVIAYCIIIFLAMWFIKPSYKKIVLLLISVIGFQIAVFTENHYNKKQSEFIVFNRKGYTLLTQRKNENVMVFSNDSVLNTINDNLVIKSYLVANFSKIDKLNTLQNFYFFNDKKIQLIDSSNVYSSTKTDVVLLSYSPKINLEEVIKNTQPGIIVVDASNYSSYRKLWKVTCMKKKILFHDTTEKGFYILK